jgi:hypothetical protein
LKRKLQRLITVSFLQKFQPFRVKAARDVHKMRNLLEKVKKRDDEQVKTDAQAIYQAENRKQAAGWPALLPTLATELSQPGATTGSHFIS